MIQAHKLYLHYGDQTVFDHISLQLQQTDRIGLVGRNGAGKTTLLKAFQDPKILDSGSVTIKKGKKLAYLPQEVILASERSILDETFSAFTAVDQLQQELARLEQQLATNATDLALLDRYTTLQAELMEHQPEHLLAQVKKILMGLGFAATSFTQPVSSLSVGWKMRIVLAKLLLRAADFYLFDEPTNHLDLVAKEWFLNFLESAPFGFILICHERYFLDELCDKILDLDRGQATWYTGNYADYLTQKAHQA
ncbi:MAG TPA: ATP-binding cassette domain-containing protein, partial [Candidatus Babeliales bacterium]|nr:ATP-binding cassette domain-containing protein [Candidatus Babeliales bacterium]